jgi:hypothetical protein
MAEEAGAPEHARGGLHGVQREPHATADGGQGNGISPASSSRRPDGQTRDRYVDSAASEGVER